MISKYLIFSIAVSNEDVFNILHAGIIFFINGFPVAHKHKHRHSGFIPGQHKKNI